MHCIAHSDTTAVRSCHACLAPLCRDCSEEVLGTFFCASCLQERLAVGERRDELSEHEREPPLKMAWAAGLLSLVPGLGQVYVGLVTRGVAHFVILLVIAQLAGVVSGVLAPLFALGWIVYYVWQLADAVGCARDVNRLGRVPDREEARALGRGPIPGTQRGSRRFGILLVVVGGVLALQNFGFAGWIGPTLATWWPVLLIAFGAWLMHRSRVERDEAHRAARLDLDAAAAAGEGGWREKEARS